MLELTENPDRLFLRRDALAQGYDDRALHRALRRGELVRIRQGAYTAAELWHDADATEKFRLRGRAVVRSHGRTVALSHQSAAVEYGVATWGVDYSRVHVTCVDCKVSRTTRDVIYHAGSWQPEDIWQYDDHLLVAPSRAAVETALLLPVEAGVCVMDSFLDHGYLTLEELYSRARLFVRWPNGQRLWIAVPLVREGAQSVGESRFRLLCRGQHLPMPVLQFKVYDHRGRLIGIADFAWPEYGLLGEFDGRIKYHRLRLPGETIEQAVIREKDREDRMREATGWRMLRSIWGDLYIPVATGNRVRRMLTIGGTAA